MEYSDYAKLRDSVGYTDYRVAKMTNITPSTFSDWKCGRCKPKNDKLEKIRRALGFSLTDFYDTEDNLEFLRKYTGLSFDVVEKIEKNPLTLLAEEDAMILSQYHKLTSANKQVLKTTLIALLDSQDKTL